MQPPKSCVCVICGVRPAETVDHVPPKCFFKGVEDAQLRTVPACSICNNGASSDDEDVRFYISAQIGKQNPASAALWDGGAYRTITRKLKLRKSFLANTREIQVCEEDGSTTNRLSFHVPFGTYQRVFERTTRGLYFFHTGLILPAAIPVSATMLAGTPNLDTDEIRMLNVEAIGKGACVYRYGVAAEDVNSSLWIYEFHKAHWALVTTGSTE
ncbi:MAG: hypothetical protein GZ093_02125 [Rhodoferax sp.]|uniref:hypothetical protein n=1 Tax=Rhodoferax sp. TaxID=50421 RepID=UPI0013FFB15B|nr:hypothetical protein [Rhodoferax sp.]NDP37540.1 hypothetical protein [Rhodoferax sp.]